MVRGIVLALGAFLAAFGFGVCGAQAGTLSYVGSLSVSGAVGQLEGPLAAAGQTLVAAGTGGGYLFSEPAAGWATEREAATLLDTNGATVVPTDVAATTGAVALNEHTGPFGPPFEDVFAEPPSGWAGTVHQAASLRASDGAQLGAPSISGGTVVAVGADPQTGISSVYVFVEPPQGWSGTVSEAARLSDPAGAMLQYAAVSGSTIVAAGTSGVEVFIEPRSGWSGSAAPAATLLDPFGVAGGPVSISGRTVLAGWDVFSEPRAGWAGRVAAAGRAVPSFGGGGCCETIAGPVVAMSAYEATNDHQCPCDGWVSVFTRPRNGWSGVLTAHRSLGPVIAQNVPVHPALSGQYLFVGGGVMIPIDRISGTFGQLTPPPRARDVHATTFGFASRKPVLRLTMSSGGGLAPLSSVTIALPHGLSFARNHTRLAAGVSVSAPGVSASQPGRYKLLLRHGQLTVLLKTPVDRVVITIRAAALLESTARAHQVANAPHRRITLRLPLKVAGPWGLEASIVLRIIAR